MGLIGFNSGMSDALHKIMEQRLKQKQQDFENNLKTQEAQQKAEAHAADLELKRETLSQVRQQKLDANAEKLQKNIGVGGETTAAQDKQLSDANLPVSGGVTLPSVTKVGFGGPMADVAPPPDLSGDAPPASPEVPPPAPAPTPPAGGTLQTSAAAAQPVFHPGVDQRAQPAQPYNPVTGAGGRVPTLNTGSAEQRAAVAQKKTWVDIGNQMWGGDTQAQQMFGQLMAQGSDPKTAIEAVKAFKDKGPAGRQPSFENNLFNPKTKNAVVYDAAGASGPGLYDVATHEFVAAPGHYQAPRDPLTEALLQERLTGAKALAQSPKDILAGMRSGDIAADQTGLARAGTWALIEAEAARQAKEDREAGRPVFDLKKAQLEWRAALRLTQSLNSPQQVAMSQAITSTDHALNLVDSLAQEWDSAGWGTLSKARLEMAKAGLGDFANLTAGERLKAQSLANRLDAEINDVTLNLGTIYGRGTPTDATRELAGQNLKAWWAKGTVHDLVELSQWNLSNFSMAMRTNQANTGGQPNVALPLPNSDGQGTLKTTTPAATPAASGLPAGVTISRD